MCETKVKKNKQLRNEMFCTDNDKNNGRNLTAVEVFNCDRGMVDKKLVDSIID